MAREAAPEKKVSRGALLRRRAGRVILKLIVAYVGVTALWVLSYRWINPPTTTLMIRDVMDGLEVRRNWMDIDDMSSKIPAAAIAAEDGRFCEHWGFDFGAMAKAAEKNAKGKKLRGGSTISQQVAKNAFLWPERSYVRKGMEAYFTVLIEALWGKKRIMEVYLNIIEWGPGIYGADAAAVHFYGKHANRLTSREAARLIAVLPSPIKNSPRDMSGKFARKANRVKAQLPGVSADFAGCVR